MGKPTFVTIVFLLGTVILHLFPFSEWRSGFTENYLSLHIILETVGIVVSIAIFAVGWITAEHTKSSELLVLTSMSLAVGILDLGHTLGFHGMPDFITPNHQDKAIDFWLVSRFTSAVSLLYVSLAPSRKIYSRWPKYLLLVGTTLWALAWSWLIVCRPNCLPQMFVPGVGLTHLKIGLEASVAILSFAAGLSFYRRTAHRDVISFQWIACACFIFGMSGTFFTRYGSFDDMYVFAGHVYKAVGFLLIFRAVLIECVSRPFLEAKHSAAEAIAANQSRTRFLANVSHEFRTPLGIISGFAEQLQESFSWGDKERKWVDTIHRNSQQLRAMINDLLDLAKVEYESVEVLETSFKLNEAIDDVITSFRLQADKKGIHLSFESALPEQIVVTDRSRLRQVLINLIGNAIKFTSRGHVSVLLSAVGSHVVICVEDTGLGIGKEDAKRLFEPFMQADDPSLRRFGGTGLGLALSKKLCEALDIELKLVRSELGKGSVFSLTLPFAADALVAAVPVNGGLENAVGATPVFEGKNILIVEDSLDNQDLISIYFEPTLAHLTFAANGVEALEVVAQNSFDLILMDIQMPVMDGFEAVIQLRRRNWPGPIIALSAHALQPEIDRALKNGFNDYVTKPIDLAALWASVSRWVG